MQAPHFYIVVGDQYVSRFQVMAKKRVSLTKNKHRALPFRIRQDAEQVAIEVRKEETNVQVKEEV
ncbi:hypothetical protein HCA63_17045 [Listeria booriae]|uniref:hypothetical protein n=1 Tax=Listeria booriae TaxID=1552123 RepID=UPI0016246965|nr:hypothetical protein [Listeria booriae]MBC1890066.1 hypothetical protein [Listeria booriae]